MDTPTKAPRPQEERIDMIKKWLAETATKEQAGKEQANQEQITS